MKQDFKSFLIDRSTSVREAMRQLDSSAGKIIFVVDNRGRLYGSLSDGDVRRWILSGGSLDNEVQDVCNRNPVSYESDYDLKTVKQEMLSKRIECIPIVDSDRQIVELLFWSEAFGEHAELKKKEKLDLPVIIMAGGMGTRLDPFTRILPKPLIPIGEKAIVELIIEKFLEYDVTHFYVSVNHKSKIIKSYFEELNPSYGITYLYEDKPLGTAGALKQLDGIVKGNIFLTNCDIIVDADYSDVLRHHVASGNAVTAVASMKNFRIPYGICEIKNGGTLVKITEKPEYSYLVNTGMYVIDSSILDHMPKDEPFHATHIMEKAIELNRKVSVYPISENSWIDVGEWDEFRKAVRMLGI